MPANVAASVKARLANLAKEAGAENQAVTANLLYILYAQERLLHRLSISKYRDNFILKGGLFLYSQTGFKTRPTRDADFLVKRIKNDLQHMIEVFKEICETEVREDGVIFDVSSISAETIKEDADYHGVRVNLIAFMETSRFKIQIDMGFNDAIVPKPMSIDYPVLLDDMERPNIVAYTLESVIAEKFEAMISLSVINTRLKDFYDVYILLTSHDFDGRVLWEAVYETFQTRGTNLKRDHELFDAQFKTDEIRLKQWGAFLNRTGLNQNLTFEEVMDTINVCLEPIYNSILDEKEFFERWDCKSGAWTSYNVT